MSTTIRFEARVFDPGRGSQPIRTLEREFNVNDWEIFSQAELAIVRWGREAEALALNEVVKKKKRLWWSRLWHRIKPW